MSRKVNKKSLIFIIITLAIFITIAYGLVTVFGWYGAISAVLIFIFWGGRSVYDVIYDPSFSDDPNNIYHT